MLLMIEIVLTTALVAFFIYLNKQQAKMFIKKVTSDRLFPKIFWGFMLGLGLSYFNWCGNEFFSGFKIVNSAKIFDITVYVRGLHFVGPLFGVFVGIVIGASSRPFSIKKLLICILAGFLGGLAYSIQILFSAKPNFIQSVEMFTLSIFTLIFMPFAIGIVDKSFFKIIVGLVGGVLGIGFYLLLLMAGTVVTNGTILLGNPWGVFPIWAYIILWITTIIGAIAILIGIEISDIFKVNKIKGDLE